MNKYLMISELTLQKSALTLALHRIETLLVAAHAMPEDGSSLKPYVGQPEKLQYGINEMLDDLFVMAGKSSGFDDSFLTSLHEAYKKWGRLTDKQLSALAKMHRGFCKDQYQ